MNISFTRYPADIGDIPDLLTEASQRLIEQNAIAVESALESEMREILYKHITLYRSSEYDHVGACVDAILDDFKALIRRKVIVSKD